MEIRSTAIILALTAASLASTTAGPPYTPVTLTYTTVSSGKCEAVLSVAATATNQAALDCSALATPTAYPTTKTKTVEVSCGKCTDLIVVGDEHGCPLITATTPVTTATVATTSWVYACSK